MAKTANKKSLLVKLPVGMGNFVRLFQAAPPAAGAEAQDKEKVYSIIVAWPKSQSKNLMVEVIEHDEKGQRTFRRVTLAEAVLEVAESAWPGKGEAVVSKMKYDVLRDGDDKESWGLGGMDYIHAKRPESFGRPMVRDSKRRLIVTEDQRAQLEEQGFDMSKVAPGAADEEAYSGCDMVAQVVLYPKDHPLGGKAVNVSLAGVQVKHKGTRIGGVRADEDAFDEEPEEDANEGEDGDEGRATGTRAGKKPYRNPWD